MHAPPIVLARAMAWFVALGAVLVIVVRYDTLSDVLPVTRWATAPKSLLIALRIPLINLLTIGLVELLSRALLRVRQLHHASAVGAVLFSTLAVKAGIEAAEILRWPASSGWAFPALIAVLIAGLGTAAYLGRDVSEHWRQLHMTRLETASAAALIGGIVALNLPILPR